MAAEELTPEEQGKRLRIARELAEVTRDELGIHFEREGFKKGDPAAIERQPERTEREIRRVPFTPGRRELAARVLGVPVEFFTEPDYRRLFAPSASPDLRAEVARLRQDFEDQLQELRQSLERFSREAEEVADDALADKARRDERSSQSSGPPPREANHPAPQPSTQGGQS